MNAIAKKVNTPAKAAKSKISRGERLNGYDQDLAQKVIKTLEEFLITGKWCPCWEEIPYNAVTGNFYSGSNIITLSAAYRARKTASGPAFLTFNQAKTAGGHVRKGAKSEQIVFFKRLTIEGERLENPQNLPVAAGFDFKEAESKEIAFLQFSNVFFIEDTEGCSSIAAAPEGISPVDAFAAFERVKKIEEASGAAKLADYRLKRVYWEPDYMPRNAHEAAVAATAKIQSLTALTEHIVDRRALKADEADRSLAESLVEEFATAFTTGRLGLPFAFSRVDEFAKDWIQLISRRPEIVRKACSVASRIAEVICAWDKKASEAECEVIIDALPLIEEPIIAA